MSERDDFNLEDYLIEDFHDRKHPKQSLIDIFLFDPVYYDSLLDTRSIDARAAYFIAKCSTELKNTQICNHAFRKLKYLQIIDSFLGKYSIDHLTWKMFDDALQQQNNSEIATDSKGEGRMTSINDNAASYSDKAIKCPYDDEIIQFLKQDHTIVNNQKLTYPIYKCPKCKKEYTSVKIKKDMQMFTVGGRQYRNLRPDNIRSSKRPKLEDHAKKSAINNKITEKQTGKKDDEPLNRCYIFKGKVPARCLNVNCRSELKRKEFIYKNKSSVIRCEGHGFYCPKCDIYYMSEDVYERNKNQFVFMGTIHSEALTNKMYPSTEKPVSNRNNKKTTGSNTVAPKVTTKLKPTEKSVPRIDVKDFVVRQNKFKCFHRAHKIEEIDAVIGIMNSRGEIHEMLVHAGYCPQCKDYFILESTYQRIKKYGIIACRVSDEETYIRNHQSFNGRTLAMESILMQYGYNVSQKENLSDSQRHRILEMIVDNRICSKTEVINLLEYFIAMRAKQNTDRYNLAISKWEDDRNYIEKYKLGSNRTVIVRSISRK